MEHNYFPIIVKYLDTGEEVAVMTPEEIEGGRQFRVLKTQEKPE